MHANDPSFSVNSLARPLVEALVQESAALGVTIERSAAGAVIIDAGVKAPGGLEAGRRIAEICLGGLGRVGFAPAPGDAPYPLLVTVDAANPVVACLGSQYAGWRLQDGEFFAMASGPGRARALKEEIFGDLGYRDETGDVAVFVLEADRPPPDDLIAHVAEDCAVSPERLRFILTPTTSLAGAVQIAARSLEVALHKAHTLKFPLGNIRDGFGVAPVPPPSPDFVTAMGRTNDAILYGGRVALFVAGPEADIKKLADKLPSSASRDYGRPFAEIFDTYERDFYKIDPLLFSPGQVDVTALSTGRCFRRGRIDIKVLTASFGVR
jgi:methenyltetrahydromethanopterin cyclohydrolase